MCVAAPPMCKSARNDVCGQFQPCTSSSQTNPTPDVTLTLTLTLIPTLWGLEVGTRGRQEVGRGSPAIQESLILRAHVKNVARIRASIRVVAQGFLRVIYTHRSMFHLWLPFLLLFFVG